MHLKGTTSVQAATKAATKTTFEPLSKEQRAKAEYEQLKLAEAEAVQRYQNISATYFSIQTQVSQAARTLEGIRARKQKLEVYVKDLDNSITAGRWYVFHKWSHDDTLVYVKEVRRPKKYTWVTMACIRPAQVWNGSKRVNTGNFEVAIIEANYPVIRECLQEETEQGRLAVLTRWGHSAEELLKKTEEVWKGRPPARLTAKDPEYEIRRKGILKTIYFETSTDERSE